MNLGWLFLSFKGRIGRLPYWVATITVLVFVLLNNSFIRLVSTQTDHLSTLSDPKAKLSQAGLWLMVMLVLLAIACLGAWASFAVQAKRWHDRNKSAWWILIGMIPIIGWIWAFVECGCLAGTAGVNTYGAASDAAAVEDVFT